MFFNSHVYVFEICMFIYKKGLMMTTIIMIINSGASELRPKIPFSYELRINRKARVNSIDCDLFFGRNPFGSRFTRRSISKRLPLKRFYDQVNCQTALIFYITSSFSFHTDLKLSQKKCG